MKWWSRRRREEDLDRELNTHLELEAEQLRESGMPVAESERAARRALGNITYTKEEVRRMWGWTRLEAVIQDFRFAGRGLRKSPGFALTAVLTLALAIGAGTAVFTVVDSVILKPLGYHDSDRLVVVWEHIRSLGGGPVWPNPRHVDIWSKRTSAFAGLSTYRVATASATVESEDPRVIPAVLCQSNILRLLRTPPLLGRDFLPEEGSSAASGVVILTY